MADMFHQIERRRKDTTQVSRDGEEEPEESREQILKFDKQLLNLDRQLLLLPMLRQERVYL